jgi:putative sigma-54 modulation protein
MFKLIEGGKMSDAKKAVHVNIAFLNLDSSEALKQYATDKVSNCVRKFAHQDTEAHVVLKVEKTRQIAELSMHLYGHDFVVKEESQNLYASIDMLADSLTTQLRKQKEKVTSHH